METRGITEVCKPEVSKLDNTSNKSTGSISQGIKQERKLVVSLLPIYYLLQAVPVLVDF
jgi:hypothetical protein